MADSIKANVLNEVAKILARDGGLIHYVSGYPCPKGHSERYVSNSACVVCAKRWSSQRHIENRDEILAKKGRRLSVQIRPNAARVAAAAAGAKTYIPPRPCRRGHSERYVANMNCVDCDLLKRDKEKMKATSAAWRINNPDKIVAQGAIYYVANKDRLAPKNAKWKQDNAVASATHTRTRRAKNLAAEGFHTGSDIHNLFKRQHGKCAYYQFCGKNIKDGFHADHIIPISKGGTNWISNIQLTCPLCNTRKHAKDPVSFARELGLLI